MMYVLSQYFVLSIVLSSTIYLSADSALEQSDRVRREAEEYNQDLRQSNEENESFYQQNEENSQFNSEIDSQDHLEVTPPQPLWKGDII